MKLILFASLVLQFTTSLAVGGNLDLTNIALPQGIRITGTRTWEYVGTNVARCGDLNLDGIPDFMLGAMGNGYYGAGYVVYGKKTGWSNFSLGAIDSSSTLGFRVDVDTTHPSDFTPAIAAAGDVHGDGFPACLLAESYDHNLGRSGAGAVYVVFGKSTPWSNFSVNSLNGANGFRIDGAQMNDQLDTGASAGDVNGDGYNDLVLGAFAASYHNRSYSGAAYVLFGRPEFPAAIDLATFESSNADGYRIDGVSENAYSSSVSGAGDFNHDGYADILIGAPGESQNSRPFSGSAYILFGKASNFQNIDLAALQSSDGFRIDGAPSDFLGALLSGVGDFNKDGFDDVAIGAYNANPAGRQMAGSCWFLITYYLRFPNGWQPAVRATRLERRVCRRCEQRRLP
jgi:hypothetical protein